MQVRSPGGEPFFSCKNQSEAQQYAGQTNLMGPMYGGYNHAFVQYLEEQHVRPHQVNQGSAALHQQHQRPQQLRTNQKFDEWAQFGRQQQQQFGQQQPLIFQQHRSMLNPQQQQQLHQQIQQQRQLVKQHNLFARFASNDLARRQSIGGSGNYYMPPPAEDSPSEGHRPINHAVAGHVSGSHVSGPTPPPTPSPGFQQAAHKEGFSQACTNNRLFELISPPLPSPDTPPCGSPDKPPFQHSDATNPPEADRWRNLPCPPSPPSNRLVKLSQVSLPNAGQSAKERRAELKRLGLPYHSDDSEEEKEEEELVRASKWSKRRSTEGNSVVRMEVPLLDQQRSVAQISFKNFPVSDSITSSQ